MDKVYVVERHTNGGYVMGGSYVNSFEHEIVGVYTDKELARKHAARKGHSMKTFSIMNEVPDARR